MNRLHPNKQVLTWAGFHKAAQTRPPVSHGTLCTSIFCSQYAWPADKSSSFPQIWLVSLHHDVSSFNYWDYCKIPSNKIWACMYSCSLTLPLMAVDEFWPVPENEWFHCFICSVQSSVGLPGTSFWDVQILEIGGQALALQGCLHCTPLPAALLEMAFLSTTVSSSSTAAASEICLLFTLAASHVFSSWCSEPLGTSLLFLTGASPSFPSPPAQVCGCICSAM